MNNPPHGFAPPPQQLYHLCFSGSPSCSGCNPCEQCEAVRIERVLTAVMRVDGYLLHAAHGLAQALASLRVHPSQYGIQLPTPEQQSDIVLGAYYEAVQRLHTEMASDPNLRTRVVATPVVAQQQSTQQIPFPFAQQPSQGFPFPAGFGVAVGVPSTVEQAVPPGPPPAPGVPAATPDPSLEPGAAGGAVLGSVFEAAGVPDPVTARKQANKERADAVKRQRGATAAAEAARAAADAPITEGEIAETVHVSGDERAAHVNGGAKA